MMSDPSENLDPKEATEAKLCAYLEGELSPAERGEIEQHLSSNPQHRQLLADLAKTREWMRSIPTEMAPADLSEIFHQQVERSMLLDDSSTASASSMNRWPQLVLVAAIVLLTLGLGVVIVAMLRPPGQGKTFSLTRSPSTLPADTQPTAEPDHLMKSTVADAISATRPTSVAGANGESKPLAMIDAPQPQGREVAELSSADGVKARLLASGYHLPNDQSAVCFVVSTESTDATVNQVRAFFDRHDLSFEDALTGKHDLPAFAAKSIATTAPTSAPSETIYVARGLTPLQLELLSASLSTDNLNQTVKRFPLSEAPTTAPVVDVPGAIAKGQMLSVTIPQLVGPGIEKTNLTKVAEDGTISLPMIDPLPAAGTSTSDLQQRIAAKYREANLIAQATVIVQLPATMQPTTLPATQPSERMLASTQPTTAPIVLSAPATQPVAETGIEVLVVIESSKP